jgi:hypothetical protein
MVDVVAHCSKASPGNDVRVIPRGAGYHFSQTTFIFAFFFILTCALEKKTVLKIFIIIKRKFSTPCFR